MYLFVFEEERKGLNIWNEGKSRRGWCEEGVHGRENAASSHLARRGLMNSLKEM
jgi:hypothetical protein